MRKDCLEDVTSRLSLKDKVKSAEECREGYAKEKEQKVQSLRLKKIRCVRSRTQISVAGGWEGRFSNHFSSIY